MFRAKYAVTIAPGNITAFLRVTAVPASLSDPFDATETMCANQSRKDTAWLTKPIGTNVEPVACANALTWA